MYCGIGPQARRREARSAFSVCHSRSEPIFPVDNSPAGDTPRRQIAALYIKQSLFMPPRSATSLARAVSRRFPQRHPPCVFRSPTLFSACSQHTGTDPGLCAVGLPAISAFPRYSTQHLLHCRSPFGFHFCFAVSRPVWFNALGVALAAWATHTRSGGLPPFDSKWVPPVGGAPSRHTGTGGAGRWGTQGGQP
jgi:hypothetical protein